MNKYSRRCPVFDGMACDMLCVGTNLRETAAVNIMKNFGQSLAIATLALGLASVSANAQLAPTAPAATPAAPAVPAVPKVTPAAPPQMVAPAAAPAPAAAAPAAAGAPVAAKPKKARVAAAPSACKGLDEAGCGANAECTYITPKKATSTTGAALKPYCRSKPKPKAAAAAVAPGAVAVAPAVAAKPAAPAAAAPAAAAVKKTP